MKVARHSLSLVLAATVLPSVAQAQGFGLQEIGSCAIGRGWAVTARPCDDASAIFWNPAAAVSLPGLQFYGGASSISLNGSNFVQDLTERQYDANVPTEIPPHLFVNYRWKSRVALGIGAYVPYGLTSQWRPDFPGRFQALRASLQTIYVQPNIAIDVVPGRLSLGGGPIIGRSKVSLYQAVDLSQQVVRSPTGAVVMDPLNPTQPLTFARLGIPAETEFARVRLEGDDMAYGFQLGAQAKVTNVLSLGVRWLSALYFDYQGADATFEKRSTGLTLGTGNLLGLPAGTPIDALLAPQFAAGGALTARKGNSAIKHPGQVQAGLAFTGLTRTTLGVDYEFFTWSDFETLPVNFEGTNPPPSRTIIEDYKDSYAMRFGVEHTIATQRFGGRTNNWKARAGFSFATSPAPDETVTPLLPEQPRRNYNLGLGIPLGPRWTLDGAYLKVDTKGRRGRIVERTSSTQTAEELNSGFFRLQANIFALSLKAAF